MAQAGVTFDADGNLVVTTIVPPSEFPAAQIPPDIATAIADAKAASDAAETAKEDADKVEADLQPEATTTPVGDTPVSEPQPTGESPPT
jgi:hypothetical protein